MVELLARIRVALRHSTQSILKTNASSNEFIIGELKIDLEKRRVFVSGDEIHLTPIEYKLLALLAQYSGRVLTHKYILDEIWGTFSGDDTQSLRVFMANIRRKIEKDPAMPRYIFTEVGIGYRMSDE